MDHLGACHPENACGLHPWLLGGRGERYQCFGGSVPVDGVALNFVRLRRLFPRVMLFIRA